MIERVCPRLTRGRAVRAFAVSAEREILASETFPGVGGCPPWGETGRKEAAVFWRVSCTPRAGRISEQRAATALKRQHRILVVVRAAPWQNRRRSFDRMMPTPGLSHSARCVVGRRGLTASLCEAGSGPPLPPSDVGLGGCGLTAAGGLCAAGWRWRGY